MSITQEETARNSNPFRTTLVPLRPIYKEKRVDDEDDDDVVKHTSLRRIQQYTTNHIELATKNNSAIYR
jgi:hypothetical protein